MSHSTRSNSSRPFYRVKVINGMCSSMKTNSDQSENIHLLNVLNWSPIAHLPKNKSTTNTNETINAVQLSIEFQKKMLNLKSMFIDPSGRLVNYHQIRLNQIYPNISQLSKQLITINLDNITENERKTFFINIYNVLTIHGIVSLNELPKSILDLNQFTKTTSYRIGEYIYSLDDIEHGILRGNKPHSNCTQRHFTFNDPRTRYAMRRCDPRIHFALNRAARSSPQIAIYSSTNLEKALNMATGSYCNSETEIPANGKEIFLSKVFLWYKNDFGRSDTEVLRWITKYLDEPKQSLLKNLLDQASTNGGVEISYQIFDWMLNCHENVSVDSVGNTKENCS